MSGPFLLIESTDSMTTPLQFCTLNQLVQYKSTYSESYTREITVADPGGLKRLICGLK